MKHTVRARRFAERLRDGYEDPAARLAAGGVNDVQLFGSLLTRMQGEVHAGLFAVGPLAIRPSRHREDFAVGLAWGGRGMIFAVGLFAVGLGLGNKQHAFLRDADTALTH